MYSLGIAPARTMRCEDEGMKLRSVFVLAAVAVLTVPLVGCGNASAEPVGRDSIPPVTVSVNDLQDEQVELVVGQVLNITTDSLAVDSYRGEVADATVAEFTPGHIDDSAEFNPGVTALAVGSSEVTMTNDQGGIQPLTFTVVVTARG